MSIWTLGRLLIFIALIGVGCGSSDGPDKKSAATTAPSSNVATNPAGLVIPTKAQPKLRTLKLWLGPEELVTEIAAAEKEIITGMMFRTEMAENEGMLFVLPGPQRASFWMKNTLIPLSCAYIDPEGNILEIHDMKPKDETPIPSASTRILYVLEVNQGWFARHNIKVGTQVRTERGPFSEVFVRR